MIGCHTKNLIFGVCAVIGLNATCVVMNYASLQPHPSMVAYNDHVCYPTGYWYVVSILAQPSVTMAVVIGCNGACIMATLWCPLILSCPYGFLSHECMPHTNAQRCNSADDSIFLNEVLLKWPLTGVLLKSVVHASFWHEGWWQHITTVHYDRQPLSVIKVSGDHCCYASSRRIWSVPSYHCAVMSWYTLTGSRNVPLHSRQLLAFMGEAHG